MTVNCDSEQGGLAIETSIFQWKNIPDSKVHGANVGPI